MKARITSPRGTLRRRLIGTVSGGLILISGIDRTYTEERDRL
jgi:hypothetical protein